MFHTVGKYWSHEEPTDTGCTASGDNTEKNTKSGIMGFHDNRLWLFSRSWIHIVDFHPAHKDSMYLWNIDKNTNSPESFIT